jgi:hypothetical protein
VAVEPPVILKRTNNIYQLPLWNALILGFIAGSLILYIAFQHNPQGEFRESGVVHFSPTASLFLLYAIPVTTIVFLVEFAIHTIARRFALCNSISRINKATDIFLLSILDAIVLATLLAFWVKDDFRIVPTVAFISAIVFCIELLVQHIARSVRRAQENARANRIQP